MSSNAWTSSNMSAYDLSPQLMHLFNNHKSRFPFSGPRRPRSLRSAHSNTILNNARNPWPRSARRCVISRSVMRPDTIATIQETLYGLALSSMRYLVPNYIDQVFTTSKKARRKARSESKPKYNWCRRAGFLISNPSVNRADFTTRCKKRSLTPAPE